MRRQRWYGYRKPGMWAGTGALAAVLLLLAGTGTCVASGASNLVAPAKMAAAAPIDQGAGYGSQRREPDVCGRFSVRCGGSTGSQGRSTACSGRAPKGRCCASRPPRDSPRTASRRVTWRALARSLGVRGLQLRLRRAGARPGPIDGLYGPRTKAAVARLKRARRAQAQQADRQAGRRDARRTRSGRLQPRPRYRS